MTTGRARITEGIAPLLFVSLLGANLLPAIASTVAAPALPSIARAFEGVADVERLVPLVLTLSPFAVALSGPLVGLLVDRVGSRPVLLGAAGVYAVAGSSALLVPSLGALLTGRFILGLSVAGLVTAVTTLVGQLLDGPARARMLALQTGVVAVIATGFISLSGLLTDLHWRAPFAIYLLAVPLGVIFARSVPAGVAPMPVLPPGGRPAVPTLPTAIAAVSSSGTPGYLPSAQRALRGPTGSLMTVVGATFVGMAATQSLYFLVAINIPFSLEDRFAAPASLIGVVVALLMLAFAIGAFLSVRLSQVLEARATVAVAALLIGLGHLLLSGEVPGAATLAVVPPAALVSGIGYGLVAPNLIAWLAAAAPARLRGRLFGGITAALFLGQSLSPTVWGPVVRALGRDGAIAASGGVALVVAGLLAVAIMVRPQRGSAVDRVAPSGTSVPDPSILSTPGAEDPIHGRHPR